MFGDRDSGAYLLKFAWTTITRHTLVKGWASPDDPALADYWAARRRRGRPPLDRARLRLLRRQRGRCPLCGDLLLHADHEPGHPDEWEQWITATRKAVSHRALTFDTGPGDTGHDHRVPSHPHPLPRPPARRHRWWTSTSAVLSDRCQGLLEPVARKRARPVLRGPGRSNAPRLPDYWAADTLAELGATVHLAHPLGVKMFSYRRVKNDQRDAADLADLLRMGRLPEAWIAPPATRELRGWVRHRAKLVGLRSSLKCQVHGVLAHAGMLGADERPVRCRGPATAGRTVDGRAVVDRVPVPAGLRAAGHRRAGVRDRVVHQAGQRPVAHRPRLPRDPADPRRRAGAGRGVRRRDRRHHPLPPARAARLVGRADPETPRVRHHRAPRPDHEDGMWRPRLRPPGPRVVDHAGRSSWRSWVVSTFTGRS